MEIEQHHFIRPKDISCRKVCVVGGTGNIGVSVTHALLEKGHEVTSVTRGNIAQEEKSGHVRYLTCDRRDKETFARLIGQQNFDAVIDLACFTVDDAQSSIDVFRGVGHFIQTSTVMTYGITPKQLPVMESDPMVPHTQYGKDKVAADARFLAAHEEEGFPVTILKPSTSYGPQQGLFRQIGKDHAWIDRIQKGKPIIVCDSGMALHQFMHVDDVGKAFAEVLGKNNTVGQTYNIVSGVTTWAEFHRAAMLVVKGREVEMVGVPFDVLKTHRNDILGFQICEEVFRHHSYYSGDKLKRDLPGFEPKISLEQGMTMVFEDLRRAGRIPNSNGKEWQWEDRLVNRAYLSSQPG